jgi:hypothetical protein
MADAQLISGAAAATLFVVGAGDQRKEMIRSALRRLRFARAKLIGTVLTKFDPKTFGYGYAYSYKYGYEYMSVAEPYSAVAQVADEEHKPAAAIEGQRVSQAEAS